MRSVERALNQYDWYSFIKGRYLEKHLMIGITLPQAKELTEAKREAWNARVFSAFKRNMALL